MAMQAAISSTAMYVVLNISHLYCNKRKVTYYMLRRAVLHSYTANTDCETSIIYNLIEYSQQK